MPIENVTIVESGIQNISITEAGVKIVTIVEPVTKIVTQSIQGPSGPQGLTGPQGATGPSGTGDSRYVHSQGAPSDTWTITHNLGKFPSVTVVDSGDNTVIGDVQYIDSNTVQVAFSVPFGGKAYLN